VVDAARIAGPMLLTTNEEMVDVQYTRSVLRHTVSTLKPYRDLSPDMQHVYELL